MVIITRSELDHNWSIKLHLLGMGRIVGARADRGEVYHSPQYLVFVSMHTKKQNISKSLMPLGPGLV